MGQECQWGKSASEATVSLTTFSLRFAKFTLLARALLKIVFMFMVYGRDYQAFIWACHAVLGFSGILDHLHTRCVVLALHEL